MRTGYNICVVSPKLPPWFGGLETATYYITKNLVEMGQKVTILTSDFPKDDRSTFDGIDIVKYRSLAAPLGNPICPKMPIDLLVRDAPDILYIQEFNYFHSVFSAAWGRLTEIPYVVTIHGAKKLITNRIFAGLLNPVMFSYDTLTAHFVLNRAKAVTVASEFMRTLYTRLCRVTPMSIVPLGVDLDRFSPKNDGAIFKKRYGLDGYNIVLFVGRLEGRKGIRHLVEAVPRIVSQVKDCKCVVVGSGPLMSKLKSKASDLSLGDSIVFTGNIAESMLPCAYAAADCFVSPSWSEFFGLTIIEAMASGVPVVSTTSGAIPEIVNEDFGTLVEFGSSEQLADAVVNVLKSEKRGKMGRRAREVAEVRYSWRATAERLLNIFKGAVDGT